jgi:hypothetical protein
MIQYKTIHFWTSNKKEVITFYKYNMNIRYIPAGISFNYRKKQYSTVNIMNAINILCKNKIKVAWNFTPEHWYNIRNGTFYKTVFINFHNECMNLVKNNLKYSI